MNCDKIAALYEAAERAAFGQALEECRDLYFEALDDARCVVILGQGDGRFVARLVERNPHCQIVCVDSSREMIRIAQHRVSLLGPSAASRVRFLQGDIRVLDLEISACDAVVTHYVLDCFGEHDVAAVARKMFGVLSNGGVWIHADFEKPERGLARWRASAWLTVMYAAFRVTTGIEIMELVDATPALSAAGLVRVRRQTRQWGMLKSEVWRKQSTSCVKVAGVPIGSVRSRARERTVVAACR